ncbi:MAG: hypothetical protein IPH00_15485 [Flavobacteriales bacterium]|nr:hypothetical protein [Flavobacteriales bacterium]
MALAEQAKTQKEAFETRYKQIEDLLPGATAVGMAAAYREQKNANREPLWIRSAVFVVTMALMIGTPSPISSQQKRSAVRSCGC